MRLLRLALLSRVVTAATPRVLRQTLEIGGPRQGHFRVGARGDADVGHDHCCELCRHDDVHH